MIDTSTPKLCPYHNNIKLIRATANDTRFTIRVHDEHQQNLIRWFNLRMSGAICTCDTTGAADRND